MLNAQRIREILTEARDDLRRCEELRTNTLHMIGAYEKRLELLGAGDNMLPLPGVESIVKLDVKPIPKGPKPSNKDCFEAVLSESTTPLTAKEVWELAKQRGASSSSTNPRRTADSVLREMVIQGRAHLVRPGKYVLAKKEAQATT
jgi:hypothetical protein